MRSLNKVQLIGNCGASPEVKVTGSAVRVAKFSLATTRTWKDKQGETQTRTDWHRCTAWDKLADLVEQYLHKGDRVYVEGSIEYSQADGKYFTDINVREIILLSAAKEKQGAGASESPWD